MKKLPGKLFVTLTALVLSLSFTGATFAAEKTTELGEKMKTIGKSLKQLNGQILDATKQQSSLDLLAAAKKAADEGKKLAPEKAASIPEADRPKFITDYQAEMDKLIGQLTKVEDAVKAGKYDDAKKLAGELGDIKREGHKNFQPPEH